MAAALRNPVRWGTRKAVKEKAVLCFGIAARVVVFAPAVSAHDRGDRLGRLLVLIQAVHPARWVASPFPRVRNAEDGTGLLNGLEGRSKMETSGSVPESGRPPEPAVSTLLARPIGTIRSGRNKQHVGLQPSPSWATRCVLWSRWALRALRARWLRLETGAGSGLRHEPCVHRGQVRERLWVLVARWCCRGPAAGSARPG